MMESSYERMECAICGKRLSAGNCNWKVFPGICLNCAPMGVQFHKSGWWREDRQRRWPPRGRIPVYAQRNGDEMSAAQEAAYRHWEDGRGA